MHSFADLSNQSLLALGIEALLSAHFPWSSKEELIWI
jgi:hypothetical protein